MSAKKKTTDNKYITYLKSTIIGLAVFFIVIFLEALIMYLLKINSSNIFGYSTYLVIFLSCFFSAIYTQKRLGGRGFITGIISSLPISVLVLLLVFLLSGFIFSKNYIFYFLLGVVGGFLGGITAVNTRI
ncbi:MAG: TIGR04086 family membrane protein [Acutalibacteraceae bacterium]